MVQIYISTIIDPISREINKPLALNPNNYFSYTTAHFNKKHKPWLITNKEESIIIGKARKFNKDTNTISITHWQHNINYLTTNYYPQTLIECKLCTEYNLNSN